MSPISLSLLVIWSAFAAGALSGAVIGCLFTNEQWLGGYQSRSRRLVRLGHIACFGIGFINLAWVCTAHIIHYESWTVSYLLLVANIAMPLVCMLTAWKKICYYFFPIPVISIVVAVVYIIPEIIDYSTGV